MFWFWQTAQCADFVNTTGAEVDSANSRDVERVRDRLNEIKEALSERLEKSIDTLYGGSVAKHTYVDGLSDVDSLLILNGTLLENAKPSEAIARVADIIRNDIEGEAKVSTGRIAVTIEYKDGMTLQVLPAFRTVDVQDW